MADITVTAANVLAGTGAQTKPVTYGGTITAGMAVYKDSATSTYKACDTSTAAKALAEGIALNGGASGQPGLILTSGQITIGGTVAVGTVYTVSDNAGGIAPDADRGAGDFVTVLGVGVSATVIAVNIVAAGVAHA